MYVCPWWQTVDVVLCFHSAKMQANLDGGRCTFCPKEEKPIVEIIFVVYFPGSFKVTVHHEWSLCDMERLGGPTEIRRNGLSRVRRRQSTGEWILSYFYCPVRCHHKPRRKAVQQLVKCKAYVCVMTKGKNFTKGSLANS